MVFPVPGGQTVALQDANLQIMPGEFVSLIGPSGCGKTTLLRLMADLIAPTGGELTVNGGTPSKAREGRAYGYVFQAPALMDWRNVLSQRPAAAGGDELAARGPRHAAPARCSETGWPGEV